MPRPLHPTALVTGADTPLGAAVAAGLAARGCHVSPAKVDLTDPDSTFATLTAAGGFDILIHAARPHQAARSLLTRQSDFDASLEVTLAAPLDLIRLCAPRWRAGGWGRVVTFSPGPQMTALPGATGIAQAALDALTRTLPRDLPEGVKINAAHTDHAIETALWLALLPEDGPTGGLFAGRTPLPW